MYIKNSDVLEKRPLHLELGCGPAKRNSDALGIDVLDFAAVDIIGDALDVMRSLPKGSVSSIYSEHFLEHVDDPANLLEEASRVLQVGGRFIAVIPHFSNPYFYSDPTHRAFFGLYTFGYWVLSTPFRRKVPNYRTPLPLTYDQAIFVFKSARPFVVRHGLKKLLCIWVNATRWTKEFYEECVSSILPCYEVRYELTRVDTTTA